MTATTPPAINPPATATATATATVPTGNGSRYLQQLCKHWSHSLPVEFTPEHGEIRFPAEGRAGSFPGEALVSFAARADALEVTIAASVPEQREIMKGVVARHLDRFAFREAPLPFDWRDAA
ncbi:MAG: DUF2218 domain-containing protein [Candidatus Andeanibacterium colombiense]|uniref:DUF2218 domain-containing protein n=1 Tax=Candidatus Andeanibacterium colombiense TaxID=3121345 RepID=A0AAJ6BM89_9SPHN|nr:MAG: DUF2218 domain-containing protein [Sphingomonadaceae bacterium]